MRRYVFISFPILLTWGFVIGAFWPWFEYRVTWDPPKGSEFALRGNKTVTYEQLRFYELGPELYPRLENVASTGCYLTGFSFLSIHPWNPPPKTPLRPPYRLHVSSLTDFQIYQTRFTRLIALFLFGFNAILNLIFCGLSFRKFIVYLINLRLHWYKYLALVMGLVILSGVCLLGLLFALGPIVGPSIVVDPLPGWQTCQTTPSDTPTDSDYDLAQWHLNRILYWGPGLMTLGVGLTMAAAISWLKIQKPES